MNIRCANCHDLIWVRTRSAGETGPRAIACPRCGQEYRVESGGRSDRARLEKKARRYAEENRIDLPSAYSVLMGIITLDRVRDVCDIDSVLEAFDGEAESPASIVAGEPGGPPRHVESTGPSPRAPRDAAFDPAFRDAVEAGHLTPAQARQRGQREVFAKKIAKRHGLSLDSALEVADNKISLLAALRARGRRDPIALKARTTAGGRRNRILFAASVVVAAVVAGLITYEQDPLSRLGSRKLGASHVKRDDRGRVVQVVGQDPEGVLVAYARSGDRGREFEAVELLPVEPPSSGVRTGVLVDPVDPGRRLAITIRHDRNIQWVAGDGRSPIEAEPLKPPASRSLQTP